MRQCLQIALFVNIFAFIYLIRRKIMKKFALVASMLVTLLAVTACNEHRDNAPNPNQPQRTTPQNPNQPPPADQR
jgi:hypothetical protein